MKDIMKATLEYNLPEEQYDLDCALKGHDWQMIVWDLDQKLRSKQKYEDIHTLTVDEVRDMIRQLMEDRNVSFDDC